MTPSGSDHDIPIVVATKPITKQERRLALAAVIVLLTGTMIWAPFASVPLARIDAFIPVLQSVMCVADLITATLLLSQYAVQAQPAFLMLASGYLAAGLFAFLQTLTFPGGYSAMGLFGDGLETPPWLFVLWHTSYPLGVLLYALTKKAPAATSEIGGGHAASVIVGTLAGVVAAVAALTWVVAVGAVPLPTLYPSSVTRQTPAGQYVNAILGLWYAT